MFDELTPEERQFLFSITDARIKALQIKALKRLSMTDEEKALYKAWKAGLEEEKEENDDE